MNFFKKFLFLINLPFFIMALSLIKGFGLESPINHLLKDFGLTYPSVLKFIFIFWISSFTFCLLLSRVLIKWGMRVEILDLKTSDVKMQKLIKMVHKISKDSGLKVMPKIGVYNCRIFNAFATGPSKSRSLVVFSSAILNEMTDDEIEGVIGHEISHIANGDIVDKNIFQLTISLFLVVSTFFVSNLITQFILVLFGSAIMASYSRSREYLADANSAIVTSPETMISSLEALLRNNYLLKINTGRIKGQSFKGSSNSIPFLNLFTSHPSIEKRIKKLKRKTNK